MIVQEEQLEEEVEEEEEELVLQAEEVLTTPITPAAPVSEIKINSAPASRLEDLLDEAEINTEQAKRTFSPVDYLLKETKQKQEEIEIKNKKEKLLQEQQKKLEEKPQKEEKKEVNPKKNIYIQEPISNDLEKFDQNQQDTNLNYVEDYSSLPYSNKTKTLSLDNINPVKIKHLENKHSKKHK